MSTTHCEHGVELLSPQLCQICEDEFVVRGCSSTGESVGHLRTLCAARAALAPELNRPIMEAVADKLMEELNHED